VADRSPAHGFCDDEQTRRLLRSRPPRQALAWAGAWLGGPVISARALRGGMSSAVHLVTARRPDGALPDKPADDGDRGRVALHGSLGTGVRHHVPPVGDVVTIVGFLDDLHDDWGSERLLVEDMLARAIAELAG
jgi:hypothetical protein